MLSRIRTKLVVALGVAAVAMLGVTGLASAAAGDPPSLPSITTDIAPKVNDYASSLTTFAVGLFGVFIVAVVGFTAIKMLKNGFTGWLGKSSAPKASK